MEGDRVVFFKGFASLGFKEFQHHSDIPQHKGFASESRHINTLDVLAVFACR